MIGTTADAALAATRPAEYLLSDDGCSRDVYLINGVVYKVSRGRFLDNEEEFHNGESLRDLFQTFNVYIPAMTMYGDVLAMEYISGELTGECGAAVLDIPCDCPDMCIPAPILANLTHFGWNDPAYGNAMWVDGSLYLIDLA